MKLVFKRVFGVNLVSSFIFLILGLFLTFRTEGTINLISSIIGIILLLNGGVSLLQYFKNANTNYRVGLIYGIVAIVAGFVLILNPTAILSVLPFILGIYFVINGAINLKYAIDIKNNTRENPIVSFITSTLMIICGLLFVINPFGGAVVITQVIGIFLVIYSILSIVNYFSIHKDIKELEKVFRD